MYQIHNIDGLIQNLTTMQVFPPVMENREGRKFLRWVGEGNEPEPMDEPQALVVDENEAKIQAKTRDLAIAALGSELPADYR